MTILDPIDFTPDWPALLRRLRLDEEEDAREEFLDFVSAVPSIARPRAAVMETGLELSGAGIVRIGGVEFDFGTLSENLAGQERVWPFLATCGQEVYQWMKSASDPIEAYWADETANYVLEFALSALARHFTEHTTREPTAAMNPGSLPEWPIEQQEPLFQLLGEGPARLGVELTATFLMLPNKSVSGIRFANAHGYENCRLCLRKNCPNRRAPYDESLADELSTKGEANQPGRSH